MTTDSVEKQNKTEKHDTKTPKGVGSRTPKRLGSETPKAWEENSQGVGGELPRRGRRTPKAWECHVQGGRDESRPYSQSQFFGDNETSK